MTQDVNQNTIVDKHLQDRYGYDAAKEAAAVLKKCIGQRAPKFALICGSGFGGIAANLIDSVAVDYKEIPGFPVSSVAGHKGCLVFGKLGGKDIACMQGRVHPYEGGDLHQLIFPIRTFSLLGIQTLLITNATGGLNPDFKIGDIMIISDQIFLPGLVGRSPLVGPNDERFGARFPSGTGIYDAEMRATAHKAAAKLGISNIIREGIYTMCFGPQYESPAEARLLRVLGSDALGMSTCHEALTAKHCGMTVFGLSLITNKVISDPLAKVGPAHEEVLQVGKDRAQVACQLLSELVATF